MRQAHCGLLAALVLVGVTGTLQAQVAERKGLTLEGARRVISGALAEAKKRNTTGVVAVVDEGGNLMALDRIDNTFAAGATSRPARPAPRCCSSGPPRCSKTSSRAAARR